MQNNTIGLNISLFLNTLDFYNPAIFALFLNTLDFYNPAKLADDGMPIYM